MQSYTAFSVKFSLIATLLSTYLIRSTEIGSGRSVVGACSIGKYYDAYIDQALTTVTIKYNLPHWGYQPVNCEFYLLGYAAAFLFYYSNSDYCNPTPVYII